MNISFTEIYKSVNRWRRGAEEGLKDAKAKANWVWEALQGDFNPNRTVGQIGVDTVVCLIPGVDTVMDVRDLIANLITIVRTPTSGMAWFSLVLTIIGFIPELGSVAKGIVKIVFVYMRPLIKHADDLTKASVMVKHLDEAFDMAMPQIVRYLNDPKVQKFLTRMGVTRVFKWSADTIRKVAGMVSPELLMKYFNQRAEDLKSILNTLKPLLPKAAADKIGTVFNGIVRVQKEFDSRVKQFMDPLNAVLRRLAVRLEDLHWVAYTQQMNKGWVAPLSERGARELIKKYHPHWVKTAEPIRFGQLDPEKILKSDAYKNSVKRGAPELQPHEIESFAKGMKARPLRDGETLYRVVDPTSGSLSTCWITEVEWKRINADPAKAREMWRGQMAVKPEWNQNGNFITYTYNKARDSKDGRDVMVWEGPTSMQWLGRADHPEDGFLEGGIPQVVFHPRDQLKNVKDDTFVNIEGLNPGERGVQFPDIVMGGNMPKRSGVRAKINDPRIEGPHPTGWGYKDFPNEMQDIIGLPNPNK